MKRSSFKRRVYEPAPADPGRITRAFTYEGGTAGPQPKTIAYRDPVLLEMARGRVCMVMLPGLCNHRTDTTVAAHSNLSVHGKGEKRKADDCYSVWACAACHWWLDFSKALAAQKEGVFMVSHARQVLAWRLVALTPTEPERFRQSARGAVAILEERRALDPA